ncbi:MAG: Dam family site-specific DNA-(adenine-N6)-methyltransferase [Anaerolineales bacterium]|nr:Dam family site-specific DNA-(adenine-N6)-methyltransferase [Anaerolineales bacterium]
MKNGHPKAKPFLKWAGGKTQLLDVIQTHLPAELMRGEITRYIEPFAGSGAVFFYIAAHYPLSELILLDGNEELILAYRTLKTRCEQVVVALQSLQMDYHQLPAEDQKIFYYNQRRNFNESKANIDFEHEKPGLAAVKRTAQLIFLNRTCYNGLFRVNSRGAFNVPFGSYKNPTICDADNLNAVGEVLQRAKIVWGDFETCRTWVHAQTFVYFDPPYGIKFGSNWQVSTRRRDVKDGRIEDATRQPEQVRAFRDTWQLGIHSYLAYLRDRLVLARELLTETGSLFVQIGDENVHLVRSVLDEVFGSENCCGVVTFQKTTGQSSPLAKTNVLTKVADYLETISKHLAGAEAVDAPVPNQCTGQLD